MSKYDNFKIDDTIKNQFCINDEIRMNVTETVDSFIFSTLSNFAYANFNMTVSKDELTKAILLIRKFKEHGCNISERWETATEQSYALSDAYRRGFDDGVKKEHDRIMSILEEEKQND